MVQDTENAAFISAEPLTTSIANEQSPDLLTNEIDRRIVKIRPMSTPIDQISRCAATRHAGAMKVDYYSVDTKPTSTRLSREIPAGGAYNLEDPVEIVIRVDNDKIFDVSDTALIPSVTCPAVAGKQASEPMVLYVERRADDGLHCIVVNAAAFVSQPLMPAGAELIRMGRAATETDVQTAQFEALPKKKTNNCQIFKMQVEQTTFVKLANKEVGWTFSDQEEVAIIDMRMAMEKSFIFGHKAVIHDSTKGEDVLLTGGIWNQTDMEVAYDKDNFTDGNLLDICRKAFTAGAGSRRKILIAGTGLIDALSRLPYNKTVSAGDTVVRWGIEFHEIRSNFGTLYVVHSETFDQCGHEDDGMIIDPEYITKYVHIPFRSESLDLRSSGVRNTDATVITEASCLVLRHPRAHVRVLAI